MRISLAMTATAPLRIGTGKPTRATSPPTLQTQELMLGIAVRKPASWPATSTWPPGVTVRPRFAIGGKGRATARERRTTARRHRPVDLIDGLTHAHRRDAGILELEREIARAKRTEQPLTLAFVDVDDLKAINDSRGHAAGDGLLRGAADSVRAHLRSYDLVVRYGGDEFVCGLSDMTIPDAAERFLLVNRDLANSHDASLTVGLAELEPLDNLEDLIERADQALYIERAKRRPTT